MLNRLNQYKIVWVFVYFDLPTTTKKDIKFYATFRKTLLKDGFNMIQYSVYTRHCNSYENAEVHKKRVRNALPPAGSVIIFEITDKQFGQMEFYSNRKSKDTPDSPQQLEMF